MERDPLAQPRPLAQLHQDILRQVGVGAAAQTVQQFVERCTAFQPAIDRFPRQPIVSDVLLRAPQPRRSTTKAA